MVQTILSSPLVVEVLLPFLLVFTLVFAILQKTKILGDGKKQIDAIVGLVVGLIVIAFASATGIIINLIPILAIGLVVLLVFMLLYGMTFQPGDFKLNNWIRGGIGIVAGIVVIITVLILTGGWDYLWDLYYTSDGSSITANIIIVIVIIVAIVAVIFGEGKDKDKKKD